MFIKEVENFIREKQLFTLEDRVLVAVSGGADSVALLRVLLKLGYNCGAAHCNFHLRGVESDRDEVFVKELCSRYHVPLQVAHFDTTAYAAKQNISLEMAARELRYQWFEQVRVQTGSRVIAVAHHEDDCVETLLLNLIRGTGINGLKGIRCRNGYVVRPLLQVSRKDILEYLARAAQEYVTDSTNLKDEYTRNKIRWNILPEMEKINPSVQRSILATATRLSEVSVIYGQAIEEGKRRVQDEKGILIAALIKEPSPHTLLFEILYPLGFNSSQIDEISDSLYGQAGRRFYSSGWTVLKDRTHLLLRPMASKDGADVSVGPFILDFPDNDTVCLARQEIRMQRMAYSPDFIIPKDRERACLDASRVQFPLQVRKWRPGDWFIPFGMKGKKKVSDYLTDHKLSLYEKEATYVVCSNGQIVWIVGQRSDNRYRVGEETQEIILLSVEKKG